MALALAAGDRRVPWYAKALAIAVAAYALSPIDLIPDFIPVLGYLDDLVILPLGVLAVVSLIPRDVMAEMRQRADTAIVGRAGRIAGAVIVALWAAAAGVAGWFVWRELDIGKS